MDRTELSRSKATFNGGTTPLSSKPETKAHPSASADAASSTEVDDLDHPDLEDPAVAWVMLVEACHLKDKLKQKEQIQISLAMARTSKWTMQVLDQMDEPFYDSEDEPAVGWAEPVDDSKPEHHSFRNEDDSQEPMWHRYQ